MAESLIVEKINSCLNFFQNKLSFLTDNSLILTNIDKIILFAIIILLVSTSFASTDTIGFFALSVISLSVLKIFLIKGQKFEFRIFDFAFIIYLLFCIISTINSTLPAQSVYGLSKTLIYAGFYFSILQYLKTNRSSLKLIVTVIALLVSAESVIGLLQNNAEVMAGATWQDTTSLNPEEVMTRVFGTIKPLNPNLYAAYILAGLWSLPCLFLNKLLTKNFKTAAICAAFSLFAFAAIFLSGCRGAYVGLAAFCVTIFCLIYKVLNYNFNISEKIKRLFAAFAASLFGLVTIVVVSTPALLKRVLSIFTTRGDSSSSFRMNVYNAGIEMFRDNFWLGIGCGNKVFREIYGLYMLSGFDALSAYCIYLEIGIESGIFALVAFIVFLVFLIKDAFCSLCSEISVENKIFILCAAASLLGVMLHGFVDTVFFRPPVQILFWSFVAVINVSLNCEVKNEKI